MASNRDTQERWETPVSDAENLVMVSLVDQAGLHITVEDSAVPVPRQFRFTFQRVAAYRNVLEEYRLGESLSPERTGWTCMAPDSAWMAELRTREPLFDVHATGCRHYIIATVDAVIDILAATPPEIMRMNPPRP